MKRINTVIFDLGNVLTKPQDLEFIVKMKNTVRSDLSIEVFMKAYMENRLKYDRGDIDYREYWRLVAGALDTALTDDEMLGLRDDDLRSWFNINDAMIDLVARSKRDARHVLLLSNIHWDGVSYLEEHFEWTKLFDSRIYSCECKVNKPRKEIFLIALDRIGEAPERCLFIDDIPENVEGARAVGMNGLRFQDLETLEREIRAEYLIEK
jgi:putative hydrolase of the HAD superfamily